MAMQKRPLPEEPSIISCKTCLDEIPRSVGSNQEADEYTQHFCGLECYLEWKQGQPEPQ